MYSGIHAVAKMIDYDKRIINTGTSLSTPSHGWDGNSLSCNYISDANTRPYSNHIKTHTKPPELRTVAFMA